VSLKAGDTIGHYVVREKIGEGGMGAVYKAEQPTIRREVVLKVLTTGLAGNREMLDRFRREVDMIARLEHPHILPVYDFGEIGGEPYIVMRYLPGGTLLDLIRKRKESRARLLQVLDQIAEALDYAHDRGVIHRDLKPANIMLDAAGNAYLGDFGLAKTVEGSHDLTATGSILGTPAYMSPEQVRGARLDRKSDIYSLAIVAYETFTARRPFEAKDPLEYLELQLAAQPKPIRDFEPALGGAVDLVFQTALAKSPEDRPARATEFMRMLKAALGGGAAAATVEAAVTVPGMARREARGGGRTGLARWWWLVVLVPVVFVGLAILGGGGLFLGARAGFFEARPQTYLVGDSPRALVHDGQALWVAQALDETVAKLDGTGCEDRSSTCGSALVTIPVDDLPVALAFDGQRVWVAGALQGSLLALDPTDGSVVKTIDVPDIPSSLILAGGSLWAANSFADTVTRIDPAQGVTGEFAVDSGPLGIAFDGQDLWVAHETSETLLRLNIQSGEIIDRFPLGDQPMGLAFDGQNLWAALSGADEVVAIDRLNGAVIQRVQVGERPVALLFDGFALWSANQVGDSVSEIDPEAGEELRRVRVPAGPWAMAWASCGQDCGDLWIASEAVDSVSRLRFEH
jgi:DNA-binding beta-propeller fold protein YncE